MKRIKSTILAATLALSMGVNASAYNWYSDGDNVRYHEGTPSISVVKMSLTSGTGFTREAVEGWVSDAAKNWRSSLPNSFSSGSGGNPTISVYAGKPATLASDYGVEMIGSNGGVLNGLTQARAFSNGSTYVIDGRTRTVKRASTASVYIVNKLNAGGTYNGVAYNARSLTGQKNTTKHEIGHALGWAGHSTNQSDVMRTTTSNDSLQNCTTRDYTQVSQFLNGRSLSVADEGSLSDNDMIVDAPARDMTALERIESIQNSTGYVHNIIVGTCVELVQGSSEVVPMEQEDCEIALTDYVFEVANYAFGVEGDNRITVRSQVGNVFEVGKEYTFAARRINSVYYDQYNVNSHSWILDNEDVANAEVESLVTAVSSATAPRIMDEQIMEQAFATSESAVNIDVAIIATVSDIVQSDLDYDNLDAKLDLHEIIKGELAEGILDEYVRLKGNVSMGETYLILLSTDEDGNVSLAARDGAIIPSNDSQTETYIEILK